MQIRRRGDAPTTAQAPDCGARLGRRAAAGVLAGLLLAAAAGCGGDDDASGASEGDRKRVKVALVLPFTGIQFMQNQLAGGKAAAADDGAIELSTLAPAQPDPAGQAKLFSDAVTTGAEAVVVMPLAPALFVRPFAEADARGVSLATITVRGAEGTKGVYVGQSEYAAVRPAAELVAGELGPDASGKIVLGICNTGTNILDERVEAFTRELRRLLPAVSVTKPIVTGTEAGKNLSSWQSIVEANRDAEAFLGSCPFDGASLARLRATGDQDWIAGTVGIGPEILASIEDGGLLFGIDELEFARAYVAVKRVADAARGAQGPGDDGWIDTGSVLVTRRNVDEVRARYAATGRRAVELFRPIIEKGLAARPKPLSALAP